MTGRMLKALAIVATLAGPAGAGPCGTIEELARSIMIARQSGASISRMMELAGSRGEGTAADMMRSIVLDAYDWPRFSGDEYRGIAVDDFGNEIARACYTQ